MMTDVNAPNPPHILPPNILIVSANFYTDIAEMLEEGAAAILQENGATVDIVQVPGALEIPVAMSMALKTGKYDGLVALGCIIRGETYHFEIVANESSRALTNLAVEQQIPLGNGILTVENREQAMERLQRRKNHKGEGAAEACLSLLNYKNTLGTASALK